MEMKATPLAAALTGVWTGLGMGAVEALMKGRELDLLTRNVVYLSALVVFFLVPVLLFVIGRENMRFDFKYAFTSEFWREFPRVTLRMLFWFLGTAAVGSAYSLLVKSLGWG